MFLSVANRCKDERTCEETCCCRNKPGSEFSRKRARKLAAENSDINDEDSTKWPHNYRMSRANVPHLENVYSKSRQKLKRKPEDKMEDLDLNTLIWGMFMTATQQAAVHLGTDYFVNLHSNENQPQRTVKQLFDVTKRVSQGFVHDLLIGKNIHGKGRLC